jgi:hypothetical protein
MVRSDAIRAPEGADGDFVAQGEREHAVGAVVKEMEDVICGLLGGLLCRRGLEGVSERVVSGELVVIRGREWGVRGRRGV